MRGLTVEDWASAGTAIMGVPTWRRLGAGPTYLHSTATRCADGCPSAALLDEIARRPAPHRTGPPRPWGRYQAQPPGFSGATVWPDLQAFRRLKAPQTPCFTRER